MKIRRIEIQNFRGIKNLEWALPNESLICLIGKGDSTKSTILEAVRRAFCPQWNLQFYDTDFFCCNPANPIRISITFGELPDEFCSEKRYGLHLRGWDSENQKLNDEPEDNDEHVLTLELKVTQDLEPNWVISCERNPEGVVFKSSDRAKAAVGLIGSFSDRELTWTSGTALARITELENLSDSLNEATRSAKRSVNDMRPDLSKFDEAAQKSEKVARTLGVPVIDKFNASLDMNSISIRVGGLALHDGDVPLRQLGLGSRRMLLCGIQQQGLGEHHITLFDEIEYGLEPHRIARLIKHILADNSGQYFLTTHSPTVLRELSVCHLNIVHCHNGVIKLVAAGSTEISHVVQGHLRSSAEAFLSKKVIICEGATEVGFLRGMDTNWAKVGKDTYSFKGVALLDAQGAKKMKSLAISFKTLGYDVMVFGDGDSPENFSNEDAEDLRGLGVRVFVWPDNQSIEQVVMQSVPWEFVIGSITLAEELEKPVLDHIRSKLVKVENPAFRSWAEEPNLRTAIGNAAKASDWFKSISSGESWANSLVAALHLLENKNDPFTSGLKEIRDWIDK